MYLRSPLARWLLRKSLVVFIYHEVSDSPSPFNEMFGLNVRPWVFARHLDLIRQCFSVIEPRQLLSGDYPRPAALITFDDGNLSYFRDALPLLKARGIPSIAFLNMGPIRGDVCWSGLVTYLAHCDPDFAGRGGDAGRHFSEFSESRVYEYLGSVDEHVLLERVRTFRGAIATERDVAAVGAEPLVHLGNHLYNHHNATLLGSRLREEFWKNQRMIDDHPRGTRFFSYPFSRYNAATLRQIRAEGVEAVFTGGGVPNVNGTGGLYYRVELPDRVLSEQELVAEVLKRYLPSRLRRRNLDKEVRADHGQTRTNT